VATSTRTSDKRMKYSDKRMKHRQGPLPPSRDHSESAALWRKNGENKTGERRNAMEIIGSAKLR